LLTNDDGAWPYLALCQEPANIPLISRQENVVLYTTFFSWEFLSGMAQCVLDTLNAPADKLLLSLLKKLGGHSAISGR